MTKMKSAGVMRGFLNNPSNKRSCASDSSTDRSVEKALEDAQFTGLLTLSSRGLRQVVVGGALDLSDVSEVDLSSNRLIELPSALCMLPFVESLTASNNCLMTVPSTMKFLGSLTMLDLSHNRIGSIPAAILSLPLESLILSHNRLDKIPDEVSQLRNTLMYLDVSCNGITQLPPKVGDLAVLRVLKVRDNQLTTLPPDLARLEKLEHLDVRANKITQLLPELAKMCSLRLLEIADNPLSSPPSSATCRGWLHALKHVQRSAYEHGRPNSLRVSNTAKVPSLVPALPDLRPERKHKQRAAIGPDSGYSTHDESVRWSQESATCSEHSINGEAAKSETAGLNGHTHLSIDSCCLGTESCCHSQPGSARSEVQLRRKAGEDVRRKKSVEARTQNERPQLRVIHSDSEQDPQLFKSWPTAGDAHKYKTLPPTVRSLPSTPESCSASPRSFIPTHSPITEECPAASSIDNRRNPHSKLHSKSVASVAAARKLSPKTTSPVTRSAPSAVPRTPPSASSSTIQAVYTGAKQSEAQISVRFDTTGPASNVVQTIAPILSEKANSVNIHESAPLVNGHGNDKSLINGDANNNEKPTTAKSPPSKANPVQRKGIATKANAVVKSTSSLPDKKKSPTSLPQQRHPVDRSLRKPQPASTSNITSFNGERTATRPTHRRPPPSTLPTARTSTSSMPSSRKSSTGTLSSRRSGPAAVCGSRASLASTSSSVVSSTSPPTPAQLISQMRAAINTTLRTSLPTQARDLAQALSDGVTLCRFANALRADAVTGVQTCERSTRLPMAKARANIEAFFQCCRVCFHVPDELLDALTVLDVVQQRKLAAVAKLVVHLKQETATKSAEKS